MGLPLVDYHSLEHYVGDLARAEEFYVKKLGFKRIGRSTPEATARDGMERLVMAGGKKIHVILSKPTQDWSVAALYLKALASCLTLGPATEFIAFQQYWKDLPTIEAVWANPTELPLPTALQGQYALALYVASSDLLPEVQKVSGFRSTLALLSGAGLFLFCARLLPHHH